METCPAKKLLPAKGCPAYRSSPVDKIANGLDPMARNHGEHGIGWNAPPPRRVGEGEAGVGNFVR
jgi:hypothetical protein